jgi:proline iminopeptidase
MHGGMGLDHHYLRPWLDRLAEDVELIYYDHRGNGRSGRPEAFSGVTHETWADDADALRAHLGHERIVVLGHSYGGFVAQEFALRHGDCLAGLILCCTAPVIDYVDVIFANAERRGTPEQVRAIHDAFGRAMADDADWRRTWRGLLPLYFKRPDAAILDDADARTVYCGAAWNHIVSSCLPVYNTLPHLGGITAPTLILAGADDVVTPVSHGAARLHAGIPGSELHVFQESGHFPFIEEPDEFVRVVRGWLSRLRT